MEREHLLTVLREQKPYLRTRFNINKIGLFGSHAKGLADDSSDIDVVVELNSPLGFKFMELCEYLEGVLGGKVDVLTSEGLKQIRLPDIAESIEKETTYV